MISENDRLVEQAPPEGNAWRVELGEVEVYDIGLAHHPPGPGTERWHDDALAKAECSRDAHNVDAIACLISRQRVVVLGGKNRHAVTLASQGPAKPFDVDR